MAFGISRKYKKAFAVGIPGILVVLFFLYCILVLANVGHTDGPYDVVEGWAVMFLMAVAAACSFLVLGTASAWWARKETSSAWDLIKTSALSGLVTVALLAVILLAIFNGYLTQTLPLIQFILCIFFVIAIVFSGMGALFYYFVLEGFASSLARDPAAYVYSVAAGLIAGSASMGFIGLTWNGLAYITVLQLLADILVFSAMAMGAGAMTMALLKRKKYAGTKPVLPVGFAGLVVGALAFIAPLASILLLKGGSIRAGSLVFNLLAIPLPIVAGSLLALAGGAFANAFIRLTGRAGMEAVSRQLPGLFHVKLGLAGGILMALLMFLPVLVAGDTRSLTYYSASNIVIFASFLIVPAGEAVIGMLAVRHGHAGSVHEAAAIAGITGAISIFTLFIGDMAKNILHVHSFVADRPLLDMYAYGSMTNVFMCYPFVLLALLTIAVCCGVYEYGRQQKNTFK